jgi:hypothetical protein
MVTRELEQKIKEYFTNNKNKPVIWGKVCLDLNISEDEGVALLYKLSERGVIDTRTISLGRILVNLSASYMAGVKSNAPIYKGFSGNVIGNNFSGNKIIIGDEKLNQSTNKTTNLNVNNHAPEKKGKSTVIKFLSKFWWAVVIPLILILAGIIIEYYFFNH